MQIIKLGYERQKNSACSLSERVYLEAEIEDWENPEESFALLQKRALILLGVDAEVITAEERKKKLKDELRKIKRKGHSAVYVLKELKHKFERAVEVLQANGVNTDAYIFPDTSDKFSLPPEKDEDEDED
ncbi:MAG: hypothetical protein F6J93_40150 [Oscillatoria sp. SIO1A7]|nr:hypothetical protein [Oscillatoria sp. SIO1A7]